MLVRPGQQLYWRIGRAGHVDGLRIGVEISAATHENRIPCPHHGYRLVKREERLIKSPGIRITARWRKEISRSVQIQRRKNQYDKTKPELSEQFTIHARLILIVPSQPELTRANTLTIVPKISSAGRQRNRSGG